MTQKFVIHPLLLLFLAIAARSQDVRFKSEVRLVEVHATVFDHHGNFVDGLQREQFRILDNGEPQNIIAFESNITSISCAVVIDTTGSMQNALPYVKNAVGHLIDSLRENDAVAIYGFNTSLRLLVDFTTDKTSAKRAVQYLRAAGQTALFDALSEVADVASQRKGKKAIIVFTDGADNASVLYKAAAENRSKQAGIPIYAIAEGDAEKDSQLRKILHSLAEQTGGKSYHVKKPREVLNVFNDVVNDLQHAYLLAYKPPRAGSVKLHPIQIAIDGSRDYRIRGRQSYWSE